MALNCQIRNPVSANDEPVLEQPMAADKIVPPKELIQYVTTVAILVYLGTIAAVGASVAIALVYRIFLNGRAGNPNMTIGPELALEIVVATLIVLLPTTIFACITRAVVRLAGHIASDLANKIKSS